MTFALSPVWIFVAWPVVSVLAGLFIGRVIRMGQAPTSVRGDDEQAAYRHIYSLRSFERRTDNVVPRQTQRW